LNDPLGEFLSSYDIYNHTLRKMSKVDSTWENIIPIAAAIIASLVIIFLIVLLAIFIFDLFCTTCRGIVNFFTVKPTTPILASNPVIYRYSKDIYRPESAKYKDDCENLPQLKLTIVRNIQGCDYTIEKLKEDCERFRVLGFDVQYPSLQSGRGEVNMLQLCSYTGHCGVFLLQDWGHEIPVSLANLLEDSSVLKVGVAPYADAYYLKQDYGLTVNSHLDLRFLSDKLAGYREGGTLKYLANSYLNIPEDQNRNLDGSYPKKIYPAAKVFA
jgi:hypothetical protein